MLDMPWLDKEIWEGFCFMRRSMGKSKPFTPLAEKQILIKLARIRSAGHDPNEALLQSIVNCWMGVWPAKPEQIEPARTSDADRTAAYLAREAEHRRALRVCK